MRFVCVCVGLKTSAAVECWDTDDCDHLIICRHTHAHVCTHSLYLVWFATQKMLIIIAACWRWRVSTSWHGNIFWRFFTSALLQEISPSLCNLCQTRSAVRCSALWEMCGRRGRAEDWPCAHTELQVCESVFTDVNHSWTCQTEFNLLCCSC